MKERELRRPTANELKCTKCKNRKPTENFHINRRTGRVASWCRECLRKRSQNKLRVQGVPKRIVAEITGNKKRCLRCGKLKEFKYFVPLRQGSGGVTSKCRTCLRTIQKERYTTEKRLLYSRRYRERHREHCRAYSRVNGFRYKHRKKSLSDGTINDEAAKEIYSEKFCYYCDDYVVKGDRTMDHKTPLIRGGLHTLSNIVMCCKHCNSSKGSRTEDEFIQFRKMHENENITVRRLADQPLVDPGKPCI